MEINDSTAAEKQKVVEASKTFVNFFVENFVERKKEKFQIATGEVEKPGKYANMAGKVLSSVAIERIPVGKILKFVVEFSGSYSNKEKATKIINLLTAIKEEKLKIILITSALFIFKNFENQMMTFGANKPEFNLRLISADAVDRVFEYLGGNKMEIDVDLITKGMIKGKSKTDKIGQAKNQVDGVATADLFEKVGLLTLKSDGTPDKYYKRKNKQSIQVIAPETGAISIRYPSGVNDQYGYRLLFEWELDELPNDDYEEVKRPEEKYAYILKFDLLQKQRDDIFKELTNDKSELILQEIGKLIDKTGDFQEKMLQLLKENGCFEIKQMFEEIITKSSQLDQRLQGMETNIKEVKDEVLKMNTRLTTDGPSPKITEKPLFHFEKRELNLFVGREKQKEDIAKLLEENTVLVHGLPGVGKSELVAQFARSTYKKQDATVVWINANTKANLEASFNKLYNQLKNKKTEDEELTDVIDGVYNHNRVRDRKILFIFDGPEMLDEQFERFLPPKLPKEKTEHRVLITSINDDQKWSSTRIRIEPLMLMGFTDEEAKTFIFDSLGLADDEENRKDSLNLAKKLFNFPLALLQAVSYIKRFSAFDFTIKDYLNKYESQEKELLSFEHFKIVKDGYDKATFTALSISIDKLIEEKSDAVAILDVISYLAPDDISLYMIIYLTGFPDSDELRTTILLLKQYSVIEQKEKDVFKIHGLIQRIIKIRREKLGNHVLREALTKFIEMVTPKNFQTLLPHVVSLWQHSKSHPDLVRDLITLKNDFIGYFHLICRGCSYEDFHAIFTIIDVKDILNAKGNEKSRRRPIHYAAVNGDPEIIKLLLENGADIQHKARQNWNVLHLASKHNNLEALKILLEKGEKRNLPNWIDSKTEYGFTALHLSARNGHTDIVRHLLENGADISDIDENGFQAVHHAAKNNHLETVKLLLENNGNVDAKTEKIEIVKGTKKRKDFWGAGKTPLQFASMYGYSDMVVMLLEHDASVNLINDDGFTPLHYAAFYNHVDIVNILLEQKDINLEAVTTMGKTAFQLAIERNNRKIMIKIVSRIKSPDSLKIEFRKQLAPDSNQNVGLVKEILCVRAKSLSKCKNKKNYLLSTMASNSANVENTEKHDVAQTALEDDEEKTKSDSSATENFSRREGTSGMGGQLCEIELLMHFLLDGITKKEKGEIDSFYLATNMADASEFDDVVYKYDYTEDGKPKTKIIFLQAKHKEKDTAITNDTLLSQNDTGDFALRKYISSFWKISQQFQIKKSPVYTNELEDCELIMYTNANFKTGKNNNIVMKITGTENDVLNFDQETNFYYVLNPENEKIYFDLKDSIDFKILISALAQSLSKDDKEKCIDINKLIFKDFQHSLATQVLEKHKLGECKLKTSFLEDKSEFTEKFLTELTSILYKDRRYFRNPIENLGDTIIKVNDKYWKDEEYPLKLPLPPRQFEDGFISKFIERLKIYTDQPNEKQLTQKIKLKIENSFPELHKQDIDSVYSDVHVMITNWWKEGNHFLTESNRFFHDSMRVSIRFEVKEPAVPFIGRRTQLDELHKELNEKGEILISQIATVTGLGGIGKTELARQYVKEHSKEYGDNILWINAENYSNLVESFRKLADRLRISTKDAKNKEKDIKQIVLEVYKYFSDRQRRCLFIFDNAARYRSVNETDEGIDKFLPSGRNKPHVLITSRNQEWGGTIAKIKLNVFTEEEALEFILARLKDFPPDESDMKDLAKKVQYLPLALNQAVAYIKTENENLRITQKEFTIKDYLKNYDEVGEQVLDLEIDGYTGSVFKTWSITMNKIKKKHFGPKAEEIMNILAYVSPDNVPVKGLFKNVIEEEETLIDTAQLLGQYSMVTLESGNFNIHRVVQDVIRIKLRKKNKEEEVLTRCLIILWMELGQLDNKTGGPFTTHAVKAWEHATKHEEIVKSFSKMPAQIVDRLEESTRYEEAYLFGMDSWNLLERILGSKNSDHLPIMNTIGTVHAKCGRYEQALNVYKEWGEKTYDILGPDHPDTLMAQANISVVLDHLGRYQEALERLEKTLEAREEKFGKSAYDTLITKFNIAAVYQKSGMFPESLQIYYEILPELLIKFGPENEDVLMVKNGIAVALKSLGEYEEALKYYKEVLPVRKKLLGEDHPDTLLTLHGIGVVYDHQELFDKALEVYEEVLEKRRKKFSDDYHPDVLGTENNIAGVLLDKGEYQKGLEMFQNIYKKRVERLGEMHPDTLMTLHNIGLAYENLRNDDMAFIVYQDCYEKKKEVLGENHIETLKTECNLARIYAAKGSYQTALNIYRKVLPKFERLQGHDHPHTKKIRDFIKNVSSAQALADIYKDFDVDMLYIALSLNHFDKFVRYLNNYVDQIKSNNIYKTQIEGVIDQALMKLMQHEENSDVLIIIALLRTAIDDSLEDDLHRAINTGNIPVIKYLIESGADVNAEVNSMTPLLWAIQSRNEDIVNLLLDNNADPTISNSEGKQPVQYATDLLNANPENENLQTITALLMSLTM